MHKMLCGTGALVSVSVMTLGMLAGCGATANPLPKEVSVVLPDGTTTDAVIGSGPQSLANKQLSLRRTLPSGQGFQFIRIVFNDQGGVSEFADNTIAPEIFGTSIILDGKGHSTQQAGLSYSGGVYGAETNDGSGIAFEARIKGFAAGLQAASATASATATWEDDGTLVGTFSYSTRVTLVDIPNANQDATFSFAASVLDAEGNDITASLASAEE